MTDVFNNRGAPQIDCPHCHRIELARRAKLDSLLYETPNAIVVAGDHQFFPGYCMVISKIHLREMHDLPRDVAMELFQDVLNVGREIMRNFSALKMNYASLGNVDEHLHWHVMPRYLSDKDHKDHPWKHAADFGQYKTTAKELITLKEIFLKMKEN